MAILKFVSPNKKVKDNRKNPNGYYEAVCEQCSERFFPSRSTALYCSDSCTYQHRKNLQSGVKKTTKKAVEKKISANEEVINGGAINVFYFLEEKYDTTRQKGSILDSLKALGTGETFTYKNTQCTKISKLRYVVMPL
jgi:hypothetical protein